MATGTGPERLVRLFEETWQATRTGRADVPPMYDPNTDVELQKNVVVPLRNREDSGVDRAKHDIIHCYHPEANAPDITDNGFDEVNELETVQVDIALTDRTDQATGERLSARDRMVGDRDSLASTTDPPYGGISGEVQYILETVRRGLDEWEKVSASPVDYYLGNSNADVSWSVELEIIARNTVV